MILTTDLTTMAQLEEYLKAHGLLLSVFFSGKEWHAVVNHNGRKLQFEGKGSTLRAALLAAVIEWSRKAG